MRKLKSQRPRKIDSWFNPRKLYEKRGQFHQTIASRAPQEIYNALNSIVENPQQLFAVEFGPGTNPFIDKLPFKRRLFVDSAQRILDLLHVSIYSKKTKIENSEKIRATIQQTRQIRNKFGKFDVAVVNEVLTHVLPEQRTKTLNDLADSTNCIIISDRFENIDFASLKPTTTKRAQYLNPNAIATQLANKGFEVKITLYPQNLTQFPENYFIITAKRSEKPGIIERKEKAIKQL